ncbi:3'-5' exoribonuclease 1-like isoform X1 [Branchiostoma floridae x Branchiostoma belcheri]
MAYGHSPKYYCVVDFEATCVKPRRADFRTEIIEFGAVIVDGSNFQMVDEFHEYCRPVENPVLHEFCKDLTKIQQSTVDAASPFPVVFDRFQKWLSGRGLTDSNFALVTDGIFDCNQIMRSQCEVSRMSFPSFARRFSNIKVHYMQFMGIRLRRGQPTPRIPDMLSALGISQEGQLHSAISDARNICRIMEALARRLRAKGRPAVFPNNETLKANWVVNHPSD